jgi:hypothetical protein
VPGLAAVLQLTVPSIERFAVPPEVALALSVLVLKPFFATPVGNATVTVQLAADASEVPQVVDAIDQGFRLVFEKLNVRSLEVETAPVFRRVKLSELGGVPLGPVGPDTPPKCCTPVSSHERLAGA